VFRQRLAHLALASGCAAMNPGFKKFIKSWIITAFAVLVAATLLPEHIKYQSFSDLLLAALLLGVLNAFLRPVMLLLALPLLIFTLGLFTIVINAGLLYLVQGVMRDRFVIDGFGWAMLGSLIISVVSVPLSLLTGTSRATVKVRRPPPPPDSNSNDDGPVIDV
jgi:putative membrane protein